MNDKACPRIRDYAQAPKSEAQWRLDEVERYLKTAIKDITSLILDDISGTEDFRPDYVLELITARKMIKSALSKVRD